MEQRIIYLSADENLTDILALLEQTQARFIVLVVPEHLKALRNSVSIRLLQRRAASSHKELVIISKDQHIRALADRLGLPAAASLEAYRLTETVLHQTTRTPVIPANEALDTGKLSVERSPADSNLPEQIDREEIFGPDTTELLEVTEAREHAPLAYEIADTDDVEGIETDASFADRIRATARGSDHQPSLHFPEQVDREAGVAAGAGEEVHQRGDGLSAPAANDEQEEQPAISYISPSVPVAGAPLSQKRTPLSAKTVRRKGRDWHLREALWEGRLALIKSLRWRAGLRRFLAFSLLLLLLALLLAAAVLLLPAATVTLTVAAAPIDGQVTLLAGPDQPVNSSHVPALLLQVQRTGKAHGTATGQSSVPGARATGQVVITNHGPAPITVPLGTLLRGPRGVDFTTTADATIPPVNAQSVANQVPVPVQAVTGGSAGNVAAGAISAFAAASAFPTLTVTNPLPTTGGSDRQVLAVRPSDIVVVEDQLRALLEHQAAAALASAHPGDWLSLPIWSQQVIAAPAANAVVENPSFPITLQVRGQALLVSLAAIRAAASAALNQRLAGDHPARMLLPDAPVQVEVIDSAWLGHPALAGSQAQLPLASSVLRLQVHIRGLAGPLLNIPTLRAHIAGASLLSADRYLLSQMGIRSVTFHVYPNWLTRLPFLARRITINMIGQ
jgi:hypothetical protein